MEYEVECTAQYSKLNWQRRINNFDKTCQDCKFNRISSDGVVAVENGDSVIIFPRCRWKKLFYSPFHVIAKVRHASFFSSLEVSGRQSFLVSTSSFLSYVLHPLSILFMVSSIVGWIVWLSCWVQCSVIVWRPLSEHRGFSKQRIYIFLP